MVTHNNAFVVIQFILFFMHTDTQCCYLYGSIPRNGSNCVHEGTQVTLTHYILNPHDYFTNLTVKWFKADDLSRYESTPDSEAIPDSQGHYQLFAVINTQSTSESCNVGPLYRDIFFLIINNFTSDKNGYYWCQIFVNNSGSQPSQYAWFYATDSSSCMQRSYFVYANPPDCAQFHAKSLPTTMTTSSAAYTEMIPDTNFTQSPTYLNYLTVTSRVEIESNRSTDLHPVLTTVIIACLSVMVLILGTSTTILLFPCIYKCYRKRAGTNFILYYINTFREFRIIQGNRVRFVKSQKLRKCFV